MINIADKLNLFSFLSITFVQIRIIIITIQRRDLDEESKERQRKEKRMTSAEKSERIKQSVSYYVKYKIGWSSFAKVPHGSCVNVLQKKSNPASSSDPRPFKLRETSSQIFTNGQDHNGNEFSGQTSLRFSDLLPFFFSVMINGFINATHITRSSVMRRENVD